MRRHNACIAILSSRTKCLPLCIKSLWENFNYKYDYPVYVHYFDDIYDDITYQEMVRSETSDNVHFISVPYSTPSFLNDEELYYNRRNLWYVARSFSIHRKGYLHMCNFTSNMYGYKNTELEKYDYVMTHDDESGYEKFLEQDPFQIMAEQKEYIGAFSVKQRLKNGHPHQGHKDTRIGLWNFTKDFLEKNNITPVSKVLQDLLIDPDAENSYHYIKWCDTYVIKNEVFETDIWKKWISAVNLSGGIYKYRWGDNELITLFAYMVQENIFNLDLVETGIHNQGMFRSLQDYAPSVKNPNL